MSKRLLWIIALLGICAIFLVASLRKEALRRTAYHEAAYGEETAPPPSDPQAEEEIPFVPDTFIPTDAGQTEDEAEPAIPEEADEAPADTPFEEDEQEDETPDTPPATPAEEDTDDINDHDTGDTGDTGAAPDMPMPPPGDAIEDIDPTEQPAAAEEQPGDPDIGDIPEKIAPEPLQEGEKSLLPPAEEQE